MIAPTFWVAFPFLKGSLRVQVAADSAGCVCFFGQGKEEHSDEEVEEIEADTPGAQWKGAASGGPDSSICLAEC